MEYIDKIQAVDIHERKKGLPKIEFVVILLICMFYTNFEVQSSFLIQATLAGSAYLTYIVFVDHKVRKYAFWVLAFSIIYSLLYLYLTDTQSIGDVSNREIKRIFSKFGQLLFMFLPVIMFYRTAVRATVRQIYVAMVVILANSILLANIAIRVASVNAEILHSFDQATLEELGMNFQAFYYVYAFTFLILTCVACYKYPVNKSLKFLSLALALFSVYFLTTAQFALSIVTTTISLLVLYNTTAHNSSRKHTVIFVTILLLVLSPFIIQLIISISSSRILNDRLSEIYDAITGEDTINKNDGQGRLDLYWMSIKAFISSPIIGNRTLPEDGHATFFTVPADIGISGIIIFYYLLKNGFNLVRNVLGDKRIFFIPLMAQILMMGFTNPITSSPNIYIFLFYLCPLATILFIKQRE